MGGGDEHFATKKLKNSRRALWHINHARTPSIGDTSQNSVFGQPMWGRFVSAYQNFAFVAYVHSH